MATNLPRLKGQCRAAAKCNQASTPTAQTLCLAPPLPTILTAFQSSFLDCCQVPTPAHVISSVPLMQVFNCASSSTLLRAHLFITIPRCWLVTIQRCSLVGSVLCFGKGSSEQCRVKGCYYFIYKFDLHLWSISFLLSRAAGSCSHLSSF